MKIKSLLSVLFVFMFVISLNSQTLFVENFNYPAGDSIGAHGWTAFNGGYPYISVTSPGLTYTNYTYSGIGNKVRLSNSGVDNYASFSSNISSGSVYCSFMINVDSAKSIGGDYCIALLPSTSTTNYTSRFYVKDSLSGIWFGITKGSIGTNPPVLTPTSYSYHTTYLIVMKYTFNSGTGDDALSLFVFTSPNAPTTEPAPTVGPATFAAGDATDLGRVALRQGSSAVAPAVDIDGIACGTSWTSIMTTVKSISTVASDFKLNQNYPNPFNPSTKISFAIPQNGMVSLKVYDILGNEVSTLVNSNLTVGNYEVNFNALGISSGTYFYKMNFVSNDGKTFSDTKKLMLMK